MVTTIVIVFLLSLGVFNDDLFAYQSGFLLIGTGLIGELKISEK